MVINGYVLTDCLCLQEDDPAGYTDGSAFVPESRAAAAAAEPPRPPGSTPATTAARVPAESVPHGTIRPRDDNTEEDEDEGNRPANRGWLSWLW